MVSFSLDENSNDKDINSYMGNEQNGQNLGLRYVLKCSYSSIQKYELAKSRSLKPYYLWKQQFMEDRCCDEKQLIKELLISSIPHIILNFLLFFYIVLGAFLFRFLDEGIGKEGVRESILFAFTTITTIGYGNITPTTYTGKVGCVLYCTVGIPLIFLVLANNGQFITDAYWILRKSIRKKNTSQSKELPVLVSLFLLLFHSFIGGLIFSSWIDDMRLIPAVYFSFISIATIGYGDLTPTPDNWTHIIVIILFLSVGIVLLSTLLGSFARYLKWIHYIGRPLSGTKDVEVWFGGKMLTVQELITLVADQFGVCPRRLKSVLRDLDDILNVACNEMVQNYPDKMQTVEEISPNESCVVLLKDSRTMSMLMIKDPTDVNLLTPFHRMSSDSRIQKLIIKDAEHAIHALGVLHHTLNKQCSTRRSTSANMRTSKIEEGRRTVTE